MKYEMKYIVEVELDLTDWVDWEDDHEVRWLEGLLDQPENSFFIGGDIGDFVEATKVISYGRATGGISDD